MGKKNSPGCGCCAAPLCVNPVTPCPVGGAPYFNGWTTRFQFVPDDSSPLVSGTPWRSTYHVIWLTSFNFANFSGTANLDQPVTLCGLTYDPGRRRWKGYTDSPPAEPDYAYRLNFEIASNAAMSIDPAGVATPPTYANNCHRRMWISDRHDVPQTEDFALNATPIGVSPPGIGTTERICFNESPPEGYPCRAGHLIDFEGLVPKFLLNPPGGMRLSIDGLSSPVQGDLSGDYILDGGIRFDVNSGGCPPFTPGSPTVGAIVNTGLGIYQLNNACPWAYGRIYGYMAAGNPWCSIEANYQTIGLLYLSGRRLYIHYVYHVAGYPRIGWQIYNIRDASEFEIGAFDLFGGENIFDLWPPEEYGGFTDLAGCTFPPTCTISFGSWN